MAVPADTKMGHPTRFCGWCPRVGIDFDRGSIWEFAGSDCIGTGCEEKEKCEDFNLALESAFGNGGGGGRFQLSALNS